MSEPKYLKKLPGSASYRGNAQAGEIEIIDKKESSKVRVKTGILVKDELHYVVRDAVKFPSGDVEAQLRVVSRYMVDGPAGVVALASRNGKFFCARCSAMVLVVGNSRRRAADGNPAALPKKRRARRSMKSWGFA